LKGCPACRDTHLLNFSQPAISEYVQKRFEIVQLNIIGSRVVTDFDGEKLSEKRLAEKYGIRFTPTFQFFIEDADSIGKKVPRERESARGQGYLKPPHFLAMFRFVSEKTYEKQQLADYLRSVS
jgi:thioredoxin-related protein